MTKRLLILILVLVLITISCKLGNLPVEDFQPLPTERKLDFNQHFEEMLVVYSDLKVDDLDQICANLTESGILEIDGEDTYKFESFPNSDKPFVRIYYAEDGGWVELDRAVYPSEVEEIPLLLSSKIYPGWYLWIRLCPSPGEFQT